MCEHKLTSTSMIGRCFGRQDIVHRRLRSIGDHHIHTCHTRICPAHCKASHRLIGRLPRRQGTRSSPLPSLPHTHTHLSHTHPFLRGTDRNRKKIICLCIFYTNMLILLLFDVLWHLYEFNHFNFGACQPYLHTAVPFHTDRRSRPSHSIFHILSQACSARTHNSRTHTLLDHCSPHQNHLLCSSGLNLCLSP